MVRRMGGSDASSWVVLAVAILIPALFLVATSFVKISVVLSLLRNALGTGQVPPTSVITALAVVLTLFVMAPVAEEAIDAAGASASRVDLDDPLAVGSVEALVEAYEAGKGPLIAFLRRNAGERERALFLELAQEARDDAAEVGADDLLVLLPAFLTTELAEAFVLGFVLFVPFLVVDLVVANILMSLGMLSMQPTMISLPLKLLLFVAVDGWYAIAESLVTGY